MTAAATLSTLGNGPAFSAYPNSGQSISNNTWTKVQLNAKEWDTNNNFDATTNYRFTPTVAGYYQINGSAVIGGITSNTNWTLTGLYKNGVIYKYGTNPVGTANGCGSILSVNVYLNGTTDYVEFYLYQSSGTGQSLNTGNAANTSFSGALVRGA